MLYAGTGTAAARATNPTTPRTRIRALGKLLRSTRPPVRSGVYSIGLRNPTGSHSTWSADPSVSRASRSGTSARTRFDEIDYLPLAAAAGAQLRLERLPRASHPSPEPIRPPPAGPSSRSRCAASPEQRLRRSSAVTWSRDCPAPTRSFHRYVYGDFCTGGDPIADPAPGRSAQGPRDRAAGARPELRSARPPTASSTRPRWTGRSTASSAGADAAVADRTSLITWARLAQDPDMRTTLSRRRIETFVAAPRRDRGGDRRHHRPGGPHAGSEVRHP